MSIDAPRITRIGAASVTTLLPNNITRRTSRRQTRFLYKMELASIFTLSFLSVYLKLLGFFPLSTNMRSSTVANNDKYLYFLLEESLGRSRVVYTFHSRSTARSRSSKGATNRSLFVSKDLGRKCWAEHVINGGNLLRHDLGQIGLQ